MSVINNGATQPPVLVCSEVGLVHCLAAEKIPVYVGSEKAVNSAIHSRYASRTFTFSPYESDLFIEELCTLGRELNNRPVMMSYDDRLILNVSRNRDKLIPYYRFLLPDHDMVEKLLNKLAFTQLAEDYKLPVPPSVTIRNPDDLQESIETLDTPWLIKPRYRHHWFHPDFNTIMGVYQKAYISTNPEELKSLYERLSRIHPEMVVQEYIEGPDDQMYDVNMYINADGANIGELVAQKIRVYPPSIGYGCYVVTVHEERLVKLSREIASKLGLKGLINMQYKRDRYNDTYKLIEIHMRTSIFDLLGIKAGLNIPAIYHADLTGQPRAENGEYRSGVSYFHLKRELLLYLLSRKNGNKLSAWNMFKAYNRSSVIDGFSIKDPMPIVRDLWSTLRKANRA